MTDPASTIGLAFPAMLNAIQLPAACVVCAASGDLERVTSKQSAASTIQYVSPLPGEKRRWITRTTEVTLDYPYCREHAPSRMGRLANRLPGVSAHLWSVWEPRTNQRLSGTWEWYAKGFLDLPVALIDFEFHNPMYRDEFAKANAKWVLYREDMLWSAFAENTKHLHWVNELRGLATEWSAGEGRSIRLSPNERYNGTATMPGRLEFITIDPEKKATEVARVFYGLRARWRFEIPVKRLQKSGRLTDEDLSLVTEMCRETINEEVESKRGRIRAQVRPGHVGDCIRILDWLADHTLVG